MSSAVNKKFKNKLADCVVELDERSQRLMVEHPHAGDVHDLRVNLRRIRSLLWILKHGTNLSIPKKLRAELRDWGRALGDRRQLDTLVQDAGHFHLSSSKFQKERVLADRKLARAITPSSRTYVLRCLTGIQKEIGSCRLHRERVLKKAVKKYFPEVEAWPSEPQRIHQIRISSKKLRYVLEAFDLRADSLKEMQSMLGRVHDLDVLKTRTGIKTQTNQG